MTAATAACPSWCTKRAAHRPDEAHTGAVGNAENTLVSVILADARYARYGGRGPVPQVFVAHLGAPAVAPGLLVEHGQAGDLADLLTRLGHAELGALVLRAAETAGAAASGEPNTPGGAQ